VRLRLLPAAEQDLANGADFYESQKTGLGIYFNQCLSTDIESLKFYFAVHEKYGGFYRLLSKRFPFAIYYQVEDDRIEVYAVLDCRQSQRSIDHSLGGSHQKDF